MAQFMGGRVRPDDDNMPLLDPLPGPVAANGVGQRFQPVLRDIAAALGVDAFHAVPQHFRLLRQGEKIAGQHSFLAVGNIVPEGDHLHPQLVDGLVLFLHFPGDILIQIQRVLFHKIQHMAHTAGGINTKYHIDVVSKLIPRHGSSSFGIVMKNVVVSW